MGLADRMRDKGNAASQRIVKGTDPAEGMHIGAYLAWREAERMVREVIANRLGSVAPPQRIIGQCGLNGFHFSPCRCPDPDRCPHCGEVGCGWPEMPACLT